MVTKLPPEITDLDDYTESINILIHGDTGTGKTVLAAALPKLLIIAVEEGTISAKRWGSNAKVWKINHWNDLVKAYEWLRNNDHPFEWVMIDSITAAQMRCLRGIMETAVKNNPSRDPDIPAIQDHFKWQLLMKRMVIDFNELPVNMCWIARSMVREDTEGDDIVVPLVEGKDYQISAWVCGEMHLLAYLKKIKKGKGDQAKVVRRLYTNDHPTYWCKDRYDVLGRFIDSPDINQIVKTIQESEGEERPKRKTTRTRTRKRAS